MHGGGGGGGGDALFRTWSRSVLSASPSQGPYTNRPATTPDATVVSW